MAENSKAIHSPLLTPKEAADFLHVSVSLLRKLTRNGEIKWIDIGSGIKRTCPRYDAADLEEFTVGRKNQREVAPCQSTSVKAKRTIATTSNILDIDFQAPRERQTGAMHSR